MTKLIYNGIIKKGIHKGDCKMKYCSNCNAELNPDTPVCPECGTYYIVEDKNEEKNEAIIEEITESKLEAKVEASEEAEIEEAPAETQPKPKSISMALVFGILGLTLSSFTIIGSLIFATLSLVGLLPMAVAAIGTIAAFTLSIIGIVKGNKEAKETGYKKGFVLSIVSLIVNIVFVLLGLVIIVILPLLSIVLAILGITIGFPLSFAIVEEFLNELFYLF